MNSRTTYPEARYEELSKKQKTSLSKAPELGTIQALRALKLPDRSVIRKSKGPFTAPKKSIIYNTGKHYKMLITVIPYAAYTPVKYRSKC